MDGSAAIEHPGYCSLLFRSYFIPPDVRSARILLTDAKGRQIKYWTLVSGVGNVVFNSGTLPCGVYNYSPIVDGATVDTRKMIIGK